MTVPGSAAQARAIREGLLCAGKAEALSRFLGETTEEMPRDRPEVFSVD